MTKISSLDPGYLPGDLSVFPLAYDDSTTLYQATNNAQTTLKQSLTFNGKNIIVNDASKFPSIGILRLGPPAGQAGVYELVYYAKVNGNVFTNLARGFARTRQNQWPMGTAVINPVAAEYHNALKDAIINIEGYIGASENPAKGSINQQLTTLETQFLSPQALFRSFPLSGPPPLQVRFQNFSDGDAIRFLWDFGDGVKSVERSPTHTYLSEGTYTVQLNIITADGGQCVTTKSNYITVSNDFTNAFFYVDLLNPSDPAYSTATATLVGGGAQPATFVFVDQTDGNIVRRYWIFDDGNQTEVDDPNIHTIHHIYSQPGNYNPTLLILFADGTLEKVFLPTPLAVI